MQLTVKVENKSSILRKLTITVPAETVTNRYQRGLTQAQRNARVKGFRPGNVPIQMVRQMYGEGIKHEVFQNLIDESFREALKEKKLRAVGRPKLENEEGKTPELTEGKDLTFAATIEVIPEIEVKSYTGLSLERPKVEVKDEDIDGVINNIRESQAQLVPADRKAKKGDYVDMHFEGSLIKDGVKEPRDEMKGDRMVEIGSNQLIPGFEDELIGLKAGDSKTFQIEFPKDFADKNFASQKAEFSVTINDLKEKKLPEVTEEFAKEVGYESLADMKKKATESITRHKTQEADHKVKSDLIAAIIEKNPFEVPESLIIAQAQNLAQDFARHLRDQGFDEKMAQEAIASEYASMKTRAESQVRASLLLERIADQEKIEVTDADKAAEMKKMAGEMRVEEARLKEYYEKSADKMEDFVYRIREAKTIELLLSKAKMKGK